MGYDDIHISLKQMDSFQLALENNKQVWDAKHFEESELLSDSLTDVSLQDVLETIVSVEKSRRAKGWLGSGGSSHDRLKYLLAFVERYSKAIDCLVQTSTGSFMNPATMIWGLLRIVMEVSSDIFFHLPCSSIRFIPAGRSDCGVIACIADSHFFLVDCISRNPIHDEPFESPRGSRQQHLFV
jgi:hypothetical protein